MHTKKEQPRLTVKQNISFIKWVYQSCLFRYNFVPSSKALTNETNNHFGFDTCTGFFANAQSTNVQYGLKGGLSVSGFQGSGAGPSISDIGEDLDGKLTTLSIGLSFSSESKK